jgi:hypothetical protein
LLTEDALEMAAVVPPAYVLNRERYLPSRLLIRQQLERLGEVGLVRLHRWSAVPVPPTRDLDVVLMGRRLAFPMRTHTLRSESGLLQIHLGFPGGGMALIAHASGLAYADGYSSLSVIASGGLLTPMTTPPGSSTTRMARFNRCVQAKISRVGRPCCNTGSMPFVKAATFRASGMSGIEH